MFYKYFFFGMTIVCTGMLMGFYVPVIDPRWCAILTKRQEICTPTLMESKSLDKFFFIDSWMNHDFFMKRRWDERYIITPIESLSISHRSLELGHSQSDNISDVLWEVCSSFDFFVSFMDIMEGEHKRKIGNYELWIIFISKR